MNIKEIKGSVDEYKVTVETRMCNLVSMIYNDGKYNLCSNCDMDTVCCISDWVK